MHMHWIMLEVGRVGVGWGGVGQWRSLANAPVLDYVSACTCAGCYVRGWAKMQLPGPQNPPFATLKQRASEGWIVPETAVDLPLALSS